MNDNVVPPPAGGTGGDPLVELALTLGRLRRHWETWQARDDHRTEPAVTAAGMDALAAVDALLLGLYGLRQRLVDEILRRRLTQDAEWASRHLRWHDTGSGPGAEIGTRRSDPSDDDPGEPGAPDGPDGGVS